MACRLQRLVHEVGALLAGVHLEGRQAPLHPRAPEEGQKIAQQARPQRAAVHVRGDGAGARWRMGLHQQRDREQERPDPRDAEASPGLAAGPSHQGHLLMVLHAHGSAASSSRDPARHADG